MAVLEKSVLQEVSQNCSYSSNIRNILISKLKEQK